MKIGKTATLEKSPVISESSEPSDIIKNGQITNPDYFTQVIQNVAAAIYTCDASGRITMFNEAAANLWGRRPELGVDLWCGSWKIFETDGQTPVPLDTCPMAVVLKEGRPVYGHEIIVQRPDGQRRNVLPNPRPLFDRNGELVGAVNLLVDITELQQAHRHVEENEERFRSMAENAPLVIWQSDNLNQWTYLNNTWMEVTGAEKTKGLGLGWLNFVHPDDRELVFQKWTKAFTQRDDLDLICRLSTENGNITVKLTGNPRFTDKKEFVGFIGTMQDITLQEMSKAELENEIQTRTAHLLKLNEDLKKSEERYHHMVEEVRDYAIILLDENGIIQNWNKGAENIKGYTAQEAIGKSFKVFYTKEDKENGLPDELLNEARNNGRAISDGLRVRADGTTFWGSIVITALHDKDNNVIGFSKVTRDLTERKATEEALKTTATELAEKNQELESMNQELASFAYVSSHDLQEPLRKIQTFASRIVETERENLSPKGKDYFIRMQNAALRMQTLIEDLLAYSRTNTSDKTFEPIDLNKLLAEVKTELRETIDEKKAIIESERLPSLHAIRFQFNQLLTNLLSNALKFSKADQRPHIRITTQVVPGAKIKHHAAHPRKNYHHLSVIDNGIGFEPEHSQKIFEVFQRLHGRSEYSGTGIGLAICKKIAENHGGFITAESEPDKGATFHLYIPV